MAGKFKPLYQFSRFAALGIPADAVCSVDVTNQCNLRCHHCYFFEHEQPENLAVKRWHEFFEKLKAEGFPFFSCTWVGGEPLMRKEVIEMGSQYFRSEEHTSELQSRSDLVCRLLLEKKKACTRADSPSTPLYR